MSTGETGFLQGAKPGKPECLRSKRSQLQCFTFVSRSPPQSQSTDRRLSLFFVPAFFFCFGSFSSLWLALVSMVMVPENWVLNDGDSSAKQQKQLISHLRKNLYLVCCLCADEKGTFGFPLLVAISWC